MDTAELLKKVRKIELHTKRLSKNLFSGEYHSAFKGRGMSFSEVRTYQFGDDVRHIDWNVSARTGEPHIKIFEEERELTVILVVDVSASVFFGTVEQTKREFLTEICAVLAFSAISNGDKVGLLLFSERVELFLPPKEGRAHVLRLIRELLNFEPVGQKTDLASALEFVKNIQKKRSICFVLSDFQTKKYENQLRQISLRHDLIGIRVTDPRENDLPEIGIFPIQDPETGQIFWIDSSDKEVQRSWREKNAQKETEFQQIFARSKADSMQFLTTESYIERLRMFFEKRF
jgi:uncharacterized protein (DUF58 family)